MVDFTILRNLISIYLDPHSPQSTNNLKSIPLTQILNLATNQATYPIQYINEVLLEVLLEKIKPSQKFNFVEEIKRVSRGGLPKLTSFKKLHYQKTMVMCLESLPVLKEMGYISDDVDMKTFRENMRLKSMTKFTQNLRFFSKYVYAVICSADKICLEALREILNMRRITKFYYQGATLMPVNDLDEVTLLYFRMKKRSSGKVKASKEKTESRDNEDSKSLGSSNPFVEIFGNQEQPQSQIDNRSQGSDFSLKLNNFRKFSEEFFNF